MKIETMQDLFTSQIMDLYDAEQRLVKALPKMAEAAISPQLRNAFESHLKETEGHVARLERVFEQLGKKAKGETCDAMKGLISEGEDVVSDTEEAPVRDAGLIAAANRVEHYEIAAYGSARSFAEKLGLSSAASLLSQTLEEEKKADAKLTQLSASINSEALRAVQPARQTGPEQILRANAGICSSHLAALVPNALPNRDRQEAAPRSPDTRGRNILA